MDLRKQKLGPSSRIQYEVKTAFSGENVHRMCQGKENRLFVQSDDGVLEVDISATTSRRIRSGWGYMCYVPDPRRLLVVSSQDGVCAVSSDDNNVVWRIETSKNEASWLHADLFFVLVSMWLPQQYMVPI